MKIQTVFFWSEIQRFSHQELQFFHSLSQTLMPLVLYKSEEVAAVTDSCRQGLGLPQSAYQSCDDEASFIEQCCLSADWVILFSNRAYTVKARNFVIMPLPFWKTVDNMNSESFTSHAQHKLIYNELSSLYMDSIGNDTEKETNFLKARFEEVHAKTVLDCCCGVGRHAYRLGQAGYEVTGIDFSEAQIETAKRLHGHDHVRYVVADARHFDLAKKDYDGAMCMWTTYNYFSKDDDLRAVVDRLWSHLKQGGRLILDSKNIPALETVRCYCRTTKRPELDLTLLIYKRILGDIQNSQYFYFLDEKGQKHFYLDEEFIRFYYLQELQKLMQDRFELVRAFGDFEGTVYEQEHSKRLVTVWRALR